METEEIATDTDFITFLRELSSTATEYTGTLEEYLRGVLSAALIHQERASGWGLLAQILADGFSSPPAPFDPAWLDYTDPPDLITEPEAEATGEFATVQQILCYQIADLHRMADAGTTNYPHRYLGIDSPTGHTWYNFDPATFLECASRGGGTGRGSTECSWDDLAIVLWIGQIYE